MKASWNCHVWLMNYAKLEEPACNIIQVMKVRTFVCAVLSVAVLAGGLVSCATDAQKEAKLQSQATISRAQAEKIALARVPGGTIREGEIEKEKGKIIWSFDVAAPGTTDITEVQVDAINGQIVAVEKESLTQQAKEKKKDRD